MKKNAVCIFAHPDDEAFGPSGTIHKLTKKYNVDLICATKGEIGVDGLHNGKPLYKIRSEELKKSAKILGVRKVIFLGFIDGTLSNSLYHQIANSIEKHLKELKPELILTTNQNGNSGHIDHIVISMVSSYVFARLKFIKKIMYATQSKQFSDRWEKEEYFVFRPPGIDRSQIDEIVDVSDVWDIKLASMKAHASQKEDYENIMRLRKGLPKEEYFMIRKR